MPHRVRLREPHIHGNPPPPVLVEPQPSPTEHAAAVRAKVDLESGIVPCACVGLTGSRYPDALVLVVICPQRAVPAAERAVTGSNRPWISLQRPIQCAAMAATRQHYLASCVSVS